MNSCFTYLFDKWFDVKHPNFTVGKSLLFAVIFEIIYYIFFSTSLMCLIVVIIFALLFLSSLFFAVYAKGRNMTWVLFAFIPFGFIVILALSDKRTYNENDKSQACKWIYAVNKDGKPEKVQLDENGNLPDGYN